MWVACLGRVGPTNGGGPGVPRFHFSSPPNTRKWNKQKSRTPGVKLTHPPISDFKAPGGDDAPILDALGSSKRKPRPPLLRTRAWLAENKGLGLMGHAKLHGGVLHNKLGFLLIFPPKNEDSKKHKCVHWISHKKQKQPNRGIAAPGPTKKQANHTIKTSKNPTTNLNPIWALCDTRGTPHPDTRARDVEPAPGAFASFARLGVPQLQARAGGLSKGG